MAFTFPENLEQRCNAAGFIWRKDDDREEKRDHAPLHLFCVEGSGDWLKIWHKHFLPSRALPSWPARANRIEDGRFSFTVLDGNDSQCQVRNSGATSPQSSWPGCPPWRGGIRWSVEYQIEDHYLKIVSTSSNWKSGRTRSHIWKSVTLPCMTKDDPAVR